jgi:hypothetical protein
MFGLEWRSCSSSLCSLLHSPITSSLVDTSIFLIIKPTRCTDFSNLFWNETLHVSDSPPVHHQELFTVHSAMVYVIQVCRQLSSSRIRMELHAVFQNFTFIWQCIVTNFLIIKPTRCTNFSNLFWNETLHVSDSSSVHHQELFTVQLSNGICHTGL